MRRFLFLAFLLFASPAFAQTSVLMNWKAAGGNTPVATGNPLPVNIVAGGGSGGTSATDESAFTHGATALTPVGGVYWVSIPNLADGETGAAAMTTARSVHVLDDNSAALLAAAQSAIPGYYATAYNTCSQVSGTTAPICVDLNGNMYANISRYMQALGSPSTSLMMPVQGGSKGGLAVVNGGSFYQAVAASQTGTVLQSSTGATGDYLSHCVIYPASTSPGVVTVFDGSNTAANSAILFPGGSSSLSNLAPIPIPVGAVSKNGAWEVTTGANVSVVCYGKFS